MDGFFDAVKSAFVERIFNPLTSAFVIAWSLSNYKFLVVLFSGNMSPEDKFNFISNVLYSDNNQRWGFGLFYPIVAAVSYVFIYPKISYHVVRYVLAREQEIREAKIRAYKESTVTREQFDEAVEKSRTKIGKLESQVDDKDQRIEALLASMRAQEAERAKEALESKAILEDADAAREHNMELVRRADALSNELSVYQTKAKVQDEEIERLNKLISKMSAIIGGPISDDDPVTAIIKSAMNVKNKSLPNSK